MLNPQTSTWENRLLDLAHEALDSHKPLEPLDVHDALLEKAYQQCEQITRTYSRTFYLASSLLPPEKRQAARALYAFCRVSDDLVDQSQGDAQASLMDWRKRSLSARPADSDLVAVAWADTRARFHIPRRYAEQLIEGVERDISQSRYQSFEELAAYCYAVASTVGFMSMHIIGFQDREAIPYALKMGVALQLTNILRDVGEDWRNGRVYLPQDELAQFGISEEVFENGKTTENWRAFMKFQIERNRQLYQESMPGIAMLDPDGRFAIAAAAELYQAILEDIEAHDGDVFNRRAYVSKWGKIRRLPGIWWRSL
jgi:phytoene synthase